MRAGARAGHGQEAWSQAPCLPHGRPRHSQSDVSHTVTTAFMWSHLSVQAVKWLVCQSLTQTHHWSLGVSRRKHVILFCVSVWSTTLTP